MGMMADVLRTPENRLEIEQEVESAVIGHRLWTEHRDAITNWAHASTRHPMTNEEIGDWWFGGERQGLMLKSTRTSEVSSRGSRSPRPSDVASMR